MEVDHDLIARLAASDVIVSITAGFVPGGGPPPPRVAARLPKLREVVEAMRGAGVTYVLGSDAGIGPPKPHGLVPYGAQGLVDMGYPPLDVLRSITSVAARACRVADRKGRVAPGYDADLLVVAGDPAEDVSALLHPLAVYREGTACGDGTVREGPSGDVRGGTPREVSAVLTSTACQHMLTPWK